MKKRSNCQAHLRCSEKGLKDEEALCLDATFSWRGQHQYYYQISIPGVDLKRIFDAVVDEILEVNREQQKRVPEIDAIMMVGGFSSSPYLKGRIKEEFKHTEKHIVNPIEAGSAVCHGALAFGAVDAEVMLSRNSKKTYGICVSRGFRMGDPQEYLLEEGGQSYCKNVFGVFVKKGEDVPVDRQAKHVFEVEPHSKIFFTHDGKGWGLRTLE
ncbi:hypothetical protein R1sor_019051 [Riccia sorocarpa]|uniref:Heat shock protein 70 n=1 Tax=Riccia sorocarpa TaxID=122646 RepID=A0ABD3IHN2_9MARC